MPRRNRNANYKKPQGGGSGSARKIRYSIEYMKWLDKNPTPTSLAHRKEKKK